MTPEGLLLRKVFWNFSSHQEYQEPDFLFQRKAFVFEYVAVGPRAPAGLLRRGECVFLGHPSRSWPVGVVV